MKIIFGLGNPDKKYENTYHNIGFLFVDSLAHDFNINFSKKASLKSEIAETKIEMQDICNLYNIKCKENSLEKVVLVKPLTYMNLSGDAVRLVMKKYGAKLEDILIVLDDIDLPCGKFRIRESGSAGTHNGLRNIVQILANTNFKRVRIGIDSTPRLDLIDYVLSNISKENKEKINDAINLAKKDLFSRLK